MTSLTPHHARNADFLAWPFFDDAHRRLGAELDDWCSRELHVDHHADTDATCISLVRQLGRAGWLKYCVPASHGGAMDKLDSRALCVLRETLARHDGLADFAFAMQGLGSGAITLAGSDALRRRYLPRVASGEAIAAFEGSDFPARAFGDAVVTHYRHFWRTEQRKFDEVVTDWEKKRFFERI